MNIESYNYVTDKGTSITVTMAETDKPGTHGGKSVAVTIDVNGHNRLTVDDHFSEVGQGIGEWLLVGITSCLIKHLTYWLQWQMFMDIYCQANPHSESRPELVITTPSDEMPNVFRSNLAVRHIEALDDTDAFWWTTGKFDQDVLGVAEYSQEPGEDVLDYLVEVGNKAIQLKGREISSEKA